MRRRPRYLVRAVIAGKLVSYLRLLMVRGNPARAAGLRFYRPDRRSLIFAFEEVFIDEDYAFETHNPSPRIVDCGSNVGVAVAYFKRRYPGSRIEAFEPEPAAFEALERNIAVNGFADVSAHQLALTNNDDDTATLYATPGSLLSSITDSSAGDPISVPAGRLSGVLGNQPIDLLKIDVQGAEQQVIHDLIDSDKIVLVDRMIVECHHETTGLADLLGLLEEAGFGYQIGAIPERVGERQDILVYACPLSRSLP